MELFQSVFSHMVTGDDVVKGKPDPEIFLKASSLFPENPNPQKVLVFEDAPNGVDAANAGNFRGNITPLFRQCDAALCARVSIGLTH